jgi:hypothetical protein
MEIKLYLVEDINTKKYNKFVFDVYIFLNDFISF